MTNSIDNGAAGWLLEGDPWVVYRTRLDLLDEPPLSEQVTQAKRAMIEAPAIQKLMHAFQNWETEIVTGHKKADLLMHYLTFLGDIGLTLEDPGMERVVRAALSHLSPEGIIQVGINIPTHFGGTGTDAWGWAPCDSPAVLQALLAFGLSHRPDLMPTSPLSRGIQFLIALGRENGWPCAVSQELGKFRGPGRKEDPCPDATLLMLKVLLQVQKAAAVDAFQSGGETFMPDSKAESANITSTGFIFREIISPEIISAGIRTASECLLGLWADSLLKHPYMFYMGTDFRKLKAPFIWYDILHVADVLSRCPGREKDPRLLEMANLIIGQSDKEGRYTPQSVWKAWADWEFGQKKVPSRWLTFLVLRLAKRLNIA